MPPAPLPRRLSRLPAARPARPGLDVRIARSPGARLAGLAGLAEIPADAGLLLPCTRSVHTFGMRVAIDLVWLGPGRIVVRVDAAVTPRRVRACRRAHAVVELAAGAAARHGLRPGVALEAGPRGDPGPGPVGAVIRGRRAAESPSSIRSRWRPAATRTRTR